MRKKPTTRQPFLLDRGVEGNFLVAGDAKCEMQFISGRGWAHDGPFERNALSNRYQWIFRHTLYSGCFLKYIKTGKRIITIKGTLNDGKGGYIKGFRAIVGDCYIQN